MKSTLQRCSGQPERPRVVFGVVALGDMLVVIVHRRFWLWIPLGWVVLNWVLSRHELIAPF